MGFSKSCAFQLINFVEVRFIRQTLLRIKCFQASAAGGALRLLSQKPSVSNNYKSHSYPFVNISPDTFI